MCLWGVGFLNDPQWYSHLHNLLPQGFGRSCEYNHSFNYITLYGQGELLQWAWSHHVSPLKRTDFWTLWGKARVGCSERIALKQVYYQGWNRSPAQVGCMRQVTRAWCTGKTQRDGMEREAGVGIRMGNTCKSMADSCQCMAKTTTIL